MLNRLIFIIFLFSLNLFSQKIDGEKELEKLIELQKTDFEKALKFGDSILQYDFMNKAKFYIHMGFINIQSSNFNQAISQLNNAIELLNKEDTKEDLALAYVGLGHANSFIGQKGEAINNTIKALEISDKIENREMKARSLSVLAYIYFSFEDYIKAKEYSFKAKKIQESLGNKEAVAALNNNLSAYNQKLNLLDSAEFYGLASIKINEKIKGQEFGIAASYSNLGKIAYSNKDTTKAIDYYKKAITIDDDKTTNNVIPRISLADIYYDLKKYQKAEKHYQKALSTSILKDDNQEKQTIYEGLLKIAIAQKQYENSLVYQQKIDSLKIINLAKQNEEKLKLIDNQHKQNIKEANLKKQLELNKKDRIILGGLFGFFLVSGLYLFQRNRNSNLRLKQQTLELEQRMLRIQMNPHFIFNTLTAIQQKAFDNEPLEQVSLISKFANLIRQNFNTVSKKEITLSEDIDALINYIETQQLRFNNKFEYEINIDKNINTHEIKIPPMLLQIFVENAIEHGLKPVKNKGELTVNIETKNNFITFEIIDNGVGYTKQESSEEHAIDIFKKRLQLRKLGEEKLFSIQSLGTNLGTKVIFSLKLEQ